MIIIDDRLFKPDITEDELLALVSSTPKVAYRFWSLDELYSHCQLNKDTVIKIVNIAQICFYAAICGVQPCWIDQSPYDNRLVAYYLKSETAYAWYRWRRTGMYENSFDKNTK